ncbi:MAG: flagellar export chaperone FlgN [Bacteroidota bacterium]
MIEELALRQLLEQELSILEELNGLSWRKKEALLKDDFDSLEMIVLKEEALSKDLKITSDACLPQVRFFLKGQMSTEKPAQISALIEKLRKTAWELKLNNDFNQDLTRDCLGLTQIMLNSFLPTDNISSYGSSGKPLKNRKNSFVLDCKG